MEEVCSYCGEEILVDEVRQSGYVFCSQECYESYSDEDFGYMDEMELESY
jgi:hypothetical protein